VSLGAPAGSTLSHDDAAKVVLSFVAPNWTQYTVQGCELLRGDCTISTQSRSAPTTAIVRLSDVGSLATLTVLATAAHLRHRETSRGRAP
jgi:hypothetical protein